MTKKSRLAATWALAISGCLFTSIGLAETQPVPTLDPVVVTATALPTVQSQTPTNTTIVTRKELAPQQPHRLSTILQQLPGIFVDEMGGRGGISSLYLRGGDSNFTMVLLDGIPLNDPTNQRGGSVDLSSLTPERIERIEIVKGPASVFYGSDAMTGVVNIITQKGTTADRMTMQVEGGQWGYSRGVLQTAGATEQVRYAGSAAFTRNDSQVMGDRFALGTIGGKLGWSPRDSLKFDLTGQYTKTDTRSFPEGSGGSRLAILRQTERRRTDEVLSGFNLTFPLAPNWENQLTANVFYRKQDVESPGVQSTRGMFQIPPTVFQTQLTRMRFHWTLRTSLTPWMKLAGGVQVIHEDGTRTGTQDLSHLGRSPKDRTDFAQSRTTPGVMLESRISPHEHVRVSAGIRVDGLEDLPLEVSPRLAIGIDPFPRTTIRAQYGEGFKLPSFTALGDPSVGDPTLSPESSVGWDVGLRHSPSFWDTDIQVTYFHNTFFNQIVFDSDLVRMVNLNPVRTQGVELNVSATPSSRLSIKGWLTYLDTQISGTNDPLRNRPAFSGGLSIQVQATHALTIRGQLQAVGKRFDDVQFPTTQTRVPGYYRVDLATTYTLNDTWKIFGAADNLTNTRYEEFLGFEAPGTWVRFGVQGNWKM